VPTGRLGPVLFCPLSFSGNRRAALPDGTRERRNHASLVSQKGTLFVNTYVEARRTVQYVRFHEGDADSIVLSLHSGRGNSNHRRHEDTDEPEPTAPTPAQPAAVFLYAEIDDYVIEMEACPERGEQMRRYLKEWSQRAAETLGPS
jgi:hypothetical protein